MADSKRNMLISALWLLVCYCTVCLYVAKCGIYFIDADMSSELVLSKLLSQEHGVLSTNWYYSTELRVLNTQLVFVPLFHLFRDWQTVRAVGTAILLALMVLSSIFFCKRAWAYIFKLIFLGWRFAVTDINQLYIFRAARFFLYTTYMHLIPAFWHYSSLYSFLQKDFMGAGWRYIGVCCGSWRREADLYIHFSCFAHSNISFLYSI